MKKIILLMVVLSFAAVTAAVAVPSGRTLSFKSPEGTVTFSGKIHKDAGLKCRDCHNKKVFPKMKKGTVKITMDAINAGKYCGVCHNGKRAFAPKSNCKRCHVK